MIRQERERVRVMREQMEARRLREIEEVMTQAAIKIQRVFRRKLEGKTMIMHFKDVMKKLMEAEKAKARLGEMLTHMQDETLRYWHSYIAKHVDKVVKIQAFYRGRIVRKEFGNILRRKKLLTKIMKTLVDRNQDKMAIACKAFRSLLYDSNGKKIVLKPKKSTGKNKYGTKKPDDKRGSNN